MLIVSHPYEATQNAKVVDGQWTNKMPGHDFVSNYHWSRIDAEHVIANARYNIARHKQLHSHPNITVLPSMYNSNTSVMDHINKQHKVFLAQKHFPKDKHKAVIQKLLGKSDGTYGELMEIIEDRFGPLFSPDK